MPCPHNEITIVQRSQRQSAVAAAAYQSGEKLFCEYDQQVKHYPEKRGIVHNEILLPANAPQEYADRNTLWNAAEAVEKQWNSQLARRWVLTIPREIPPDQYAVLVREFCEQQFVSKGMIADFAIHDPHPPGHNPHAHVMLTMRAIDLNVFEAVKQSVTTRQAAEHYGIRVGRNGMACCPFHNDKTPSMKLDRRYHCFGCGADGDVIDFAAALYGLGKKEAAVQLAQDFGLSYEDWKPPGKAKKPKPRQKSPEEQFQEAKNRCFRILADYLHLLRAWRKEYAPHSPEEAFHPRFVEALQKQDQVEYLLDVLLFGETEEKAALITDYGKDVIQLEQRMAELAAADAARTKKHHERHFW